MQRLYIHIFTQRLYIQNSCIVVYPLMEIIPKNRNEKSKNCIFSCQIDFHVIYLTNRSVNNKIMSPRTEKQFEEIRVSKKALIQETALELFATKGYHSTSISMIARTAGISKGLLYNYYESKEDLLNEMLSSHDRNIHHKNM